RAPGARDRVAEVRRERRGEGDVAADDDEAIGRAELGAGRPVERVHVLAPDPAEEDLDALRGRHPGDGRAAGGPWEDQPEEVLDRRALFVGGGLLPASL